MLLKPISLAIVDDHALFRKTLKSYLSEQANIHVSVLASDIFDLHNKLKEAPAEVLLMDLFMPELNGDEALASIH